MRRHTNPDHLRVMELLPYLIESKRRFVDERFTSSSVHIVIGNETCDLDSAVTSVLYAYYLHKTKGEGSTIYIPVINISGDDYVLRTEVTHVFKKYGIFRQHLLFTDDLDLNDIPSKEILSVTLVDHHVVSPSMMPLQEFVVQVIDHRPQTIEYAESVLMELELVGSCATLIAEKILNDCNFTLTEDVAWMLHATILVDTLCLSEQAGRKTVKDEQMVDRLENYLTGEPQREDCFKELFRAKEDVSDLSTRDLLRKDLKIIRSSKTSIAMSSILLNLRIFLQRSNLESELRQFAEQQDVQMVVLMTLNLKTSGDAERQIAVHSADDDLRDEITSVLVNKKDPDLQLTTIQTTLSTMTAFDQANIPASRKKVLPILQDAINR